VHIPPPQSGLGNRQNKQRPWSGVLLLPLLQGETSERGVVGEGTRRPWRTSSLLRCSLPKGETFHRPVGSNTIVPCICRRRSLLQFSIDRPLGLGGGVRLSLRPGADPHHLGRRRPGVFATLSSDVCRCGVLQFGWPAGSFSSGLGRIACNYFSGLGVMYRPACLPFVGFAGFVPGDDTLI